MCPGCKTSPLVHSNATPVSLSLGRDFFLRELTKGSTQTSDGLGKQGQPDVAVVVKPMGSHFGRCTHFRTYLSGNWDVHWGYDLDFDPSPCGGSTPFKIHPCSRSCRLLNKLPPRCVLTCGCFSGFARSLAKDMGLKRQSCT